MGPQKKLMTFIFGLLQNQHMKHAKSLSFVIVVAVLLEPPLGASMYVASSSYVHPKIASGQMVIHSACIMPVNGQVLQLALKRHPEVLPGESAEWSKALQRVVESHLKTVGLDTSSAAGSGSPSTDLQQSLLSLQQSYDAIHLQVEKKPKNIGEDSFTLGPDVAKLPCAAKSEIIVFVDATIRVQTSGRIALGMLSAAASPDDTTRFNLSLVDAKSGEVVGFLRIDNVRPSLYDSEKTFGGSLDKEFKNMHLAATASHP